MCVEGDYTTPGVAQKMPDIPSWAADDPSAIACAQTFYASGGYGEMTVTGLSVECDDVGEHVFNTVNYCPGYCGDPAKADGKCVGCGDGGSGSF